jgi:hypothetical protein
VWWGFALEHVHAGFCIAAEHQTALGVGVERLGIQLAEGVRCGITVLSVAVEPGRTLVGLAIDVWQETPNTRAADRVGVQRVEQGGDAGVSGPPGDGAILCVRQPTGHRDDLDTRGGGKGARTPCAHGILQTRQAQGQRAPSPCAHRQVGTAQRVANVAVGRSVQLGSPSDNACA